MTRLRCVDKCIWVDENINKPNCDTSKAYTYLSDIIYAIGGKKQLFKDKETLRRFADELAASVYFRMTTPKQFLPEDDPKYQKPIKSCLNYINSIIYLRKIKFIENENKEIIEIEDYNSLFEDSARKIYSDFNDLVGIFTIDYFTRLNRIIWDEIKTGPYANDKVLCGRIYNSILISLLRAFTLSNNEKLRIKEIKNIEDEELKTNSENYFNDVILQKNKNIAMVYNLKIKWLPYIKYLIQKIKHKIMLDLRELNTHYQISDEVISDILASQWEV